MFEKHVLSPVYIIVLYIKFIRIFGFRISKMLYMGFIAIKLEFRIKENKLVLWI